MKRLYTVKELADEAGISTSALRAWERRFAIFSPNRTPGGHRLYTRDDLKILWYVKKQQASGRDLKEISSCGHEALLKSARSFFGTESHTALDNSIPSSNSHNTISAYPNSKPAETSEQDIICALKACQLEVAQRMVENLYSVSTSGIDFVSCALCIMSHICNPSLSICNCCVAFFHNIVKHLCQDFILHSKVPAKGLALCLNLSNNESVTSLTENLRFLQAALYLRQWGYAVVLVDESIATPDIPNLVRGTKPLLVYISTSNASNDAQVLQEISSTISTTSLCCVVTQKSESQNDSDTNNKNLNLKNMNFYFVNSMLEFEILALRRMENQTQPPQELLQNFLLEYH